MIEKVEHLSAKLKIEAFSQQRVLYQRRIHVLIARPPQDISAGVAKRAEHRHRRDVAIATVAIADVIKGQPVSREQGRIEVHLTVVVDLGEYIRHLTVVPITQTL